nr:E4 ORF6/7 [Human mastadenovirus C]
MTTSGVPFGMTLRPTRSRLSRRTPYSRDRLPPFETETRATILEDHPLLPECNTLTMHNAWTSPSPPVKQPQVGQQPVPQQLDSDMNLSELPGEFINITDERLARQETVWNITPKNMSVTHDMMLFKASRGERTVYSVCWEGGGRLNTRVL